MDDIEKLIANLPCPSPSADLDSRILQLTRRPVTARIARGQPRGIRAFVACAACATLVGFMLGRELPTPLTQNQPAGMVTLTPKPPVESVPDVGAVITVHVAPSEALTRFVMPPRRTEGLFGRGPMQEPIDSFHQQ